MQKFNVNGQSVPKIEWKQAVGRTEAITLPHSLMRSVKIPKSLLTTQCADVDTGRNTDDDMVSVL